MTNPANDEGSTDDDHKDENRADHKELKSDYLEIHIDDDLFIKEFDKQMNVLSVGLSDSTRTDNDGASHRKEESESMQNNKPKNSTNKPQKKIGLNHVSRKFRFGERGEEMKVDSSKMGEPVSCEKQNSSVDASCLMPPPFDAKCFPNIESEDEARASMLMSWYMAGYQTGYYEAIRKFGKQDAR